MPRLEDIEARGRMLEKQMKEDGDAGLQIIIRKKSASLCHRQSWEKRAQLKEGAPYSLVVVGTYTTLLR